MAKSGMSDPVKDAMAGEDNGVVWLSLARCRVATWTDRRQRAVFTLQASNLTLATTGAFDANPTAARWEHLRQYMMETLCRLDTVA